MSRPVYSWHRPSNPEVNAINKCINALTNDNFEGTKESILKINILEDPDNLEITELKTKEDDEKMTPIIRTFIDSVSAYTGLDLVNLKKYADLFAELGHNWRGRQKTVLVRNILIRTENELTSYVNNEIPSDEYEARILYKKIINIFMFLFYTSVYKNYHVIPIQVPLKAVYMFCKPEDKTLRVLTVFMKAPEFENIHNNAVYKKYIQKTLIQTLKEGKEKMKGKIKYDICDVLTSIGE